MPVFVDPKTCVNREHCFAASACPYDAYIHNPLKKTWEVDANICGECPGPCLNFCDKDAVHWGDDLEDLRLVRAGIEGTMKPDAVAEARHKHLTERVEAQRQAEIAAAEAARRKEGEGIIALTRHNFEQEVFRSGVPVVIDCWADWCAPCKQFSPIFEATAKQYVGIIKFAKLDTESDPALAQGLGVQALPTILMFYKGQLVNAVEGALPASAFQQWLYQTLAAIRQYQNQLDTEAEAAIASAVQNLTLLDNIAAGETPDGQANTNEAVPGAAGAAPSPSAPPSSPPPIERGKRTSSGLYIP